MTPIDVQNLIYEAILNRPIYKNDKWYLAIQANHIVCKPFNELAPGQMIFGIITKEDGRLGIIPKQLDRIVAKIFVYLEDTGKCLKSHKQSSNHKQKPQKQ